MIMTFITLKYMMLLLKMVGYSKFNACRVSAVFSKYILTLREILNYVLEVQPSQGGIEWRKGE